jgi:MFS transporter, DHA1 family, inner membrane transport protein
MWGFFTYLLNVQGNIIPFLRSEFQLSYRAVSLHSSALAAGMIVSGLFGDRLLRHCGRRRTLWLGAFGMSAGAAVLGLAPAAWATIGSCALIGTLGALVPMVVITVLADLHGERKNVAFTEASAVSYGFALIAPLVMSLCLALSLGWRIAVLLGMCFGGLIARWSGRLPSAVLPTTAAVGRITLPAAYWAYWGALGLGAAIEFCILLWAPEFLERVVGLSKAAAAAGAAAFFVAMLLGRTVGSGLIRFITAQRLFPVALTVTVLGFLLYWGLHRPPWAIMGLFVLGLGVALLFPLSFGLAIGTAGAHAEAATARIAMAVGLAILCMPALLGALADRVGLHSAHLLVAGLVGVALLCFVAAQGLQRQTKG